MPVRPHRPALRGFRMPQGIPLTLDAMRRHGVRIAFVTPPIDPPVAEADPWAGVRHSSLVRVPRVLYLCSGLHNSRSKTIGLGTNGTIDNPARAVLLEWMDLFDRVAARARAAMPDLWIRNSKTLEHTQTNIGGRFIGGRQFDHMICPPKDGKAYDRKLAPYPILGCDFLNIWFGSPSIGDANDYVGGIPTSLYDSIYDNIQRIYQNKDYLDRYAVRVIGPPTHLFDDIRYGPDPGETPSARQAKIDAHERMVNSFPQIDSFMYSSTEAMAEAGIDARYVPYGGGGPAAEDAVCGWISEFWGVPV